MKKKFNAFVRKLSNSKPEPVFRMIFDVIAKAEYVILNFFWKIKNPQESKRDVQFVCDNVTFIFKSFERQKQAKKLYKNIRHYYPTAKIVIADDSKSPLKIKGDSNLKIIELPFNSGLSRGLNKAIEQVQTPYVMRMDDDELLTAASNLANELKLLNTHKNIDLCGFLFTCPPLCHKTEKHIHIYSKFNMANAPKPLRIAHMTEIDDRHIVMGKVPNIWLARTDKIKQIGWDDNIRMIDHHEFFYRCAGNLVSVLATDTTIWHQHNPFHKDYQIYRSDVQDDAVYILKKHGKEYYLQSKN